MARKNVEKFGEAVRQRFSGAHQSAHAGDLERGNVQVSDEDAPKIERATDRGLNT